MYLYQIGLWKLQGYYRLWIWHEENFYILGFRLYSGRLLSFWLKDLMCLIFPSYSKYLSFSINTNLNIITFNSTCIPLFWRYKRLLHIIRWDQMQCAANLYLQHQFIINFSISDYSPYYWLFNTISTVQSNFWLHNVW